MHRLRLRLRYGGVTVPDAREREKTNSWRRTTFCEGGHGCWIERERRKREKRREKETEGLVVWLVLQMLTSQLELLTLA